MIEPLPAMTGALYRNVAKPGLFLFSADTAHKGIAFLTETLGKTPLTSVTSALYRYQDLMLEQTIDGIHFDGLLGLAAGLDYDLKFVNGFWSFGTNFHTIGTVTAGAYAGNKPPMLGRLPKSRSLWVNKGFKSAGATVLKDQLAQLHPPVPFGISIGATNRPYNSEKEQIQEYYSAFETLGNELPNAYWELNISCPNLAAGNDFQKPAALNRLLHALTDLEINKPMYLKMPVDISDQELKDLLRVVLRHPILRGIIIGNLTKTAEKNQFWLTERHKYNKGGFSGKPTQAKSDHLIGVARHFTQGAITIIGCGGVFNAHDAYRKIRKGANLIQMITGFVYEGPQVAGQINRDLVKMLKADGYSHISQVVGVE